MITLAEVLELIHSSRRRFRTARAQGHTDASSWRLWWEGDDRFRFERRTFQGTGHLERGQDLLGTIGRTLGRSLDQVARSFGLFVVPKGVEHCPRCDEEAHLLLIEPKGTPNTSDATTHSAAVKEKI